MGQKLDSAFILVFYKYIFIQLFRYLPHNLNFGRRGIRGAISFLLCSNTVNLAFK